MPTEFTNDDRRLRVNSPNAEWSDVFLRTRLEVMPALEASLSRSRDALLAMNLGGIERGTREQLGFIRELTAARLQGVASPPGGVRQPREDEESARPVHAAELMEELLERENRIRKAARLQAALLARARYKLRVLGNMLAGLSITYGPQGVRNRALPFAAKRHGESDSCRA
jgi:hypothetical protein